MPRPNASDRPGNRRTPKRGAPNASKRSDSKQSRFKKPRKNDGDSPFKKDSARPFAKRPGGVPGKSSSGKPFRKFDKEGDEKPFRARTARAGQSPSRMGKPFGKTDRADRSGRPDKPFRKFDKEGDEKPLRARTARAGQAPSRTGKSFGKAERSGRADKPFRKSDKEREGKAFRARAAGTGQSSSHAGKGFGNSDKAHRPDKSKFEERGERPQRKRIARAATQGAAPEMSAPVQTEAVRLNRYIANSGVCSRREADELITMGLITVNGKAVTALGVKVNPGDEVRYEGRLLKAEKPVYILMNKPKGYLTTTSDPQERNTVMHILGHAVKERVYPVGRLDRNTTGLLLLTNDGELADKLMHPSYNVKKIYRVELDRPLTRADFQKIVDGVQLEEGIAQVDDVAIVSEDSKTVGLEIHIGWNRVVRRIFEALDYQVLKLDRSVYAGLDKKDLGRGEWRFLRREEIVRLKHYK